MARFFGDRFLGGSGIRSALLAGIALLGAGGLTGCGERFPAIERATPITYGPPFGRETVYSRETGGVGLREARRNVLRARDNAAGHHPANPAGEERASEFLNEEAAHYGTFDRCNRRLERYLADAEGGEHSGPVPLSPIESVGHHVHNGVVEEFRCSAGTLTRRAWRVADGGHADEGHGESH